LPHTAGAGLEDQNSVTHVYRLINKNRPKRILKFSDVVNSTQGLRPLPSVCNQTAGITDWGMDGNDDAGDCVEAATAHAEMVWTANATGCPIAISAAQVLQAYADTTGYDPQTGANDNGTDPYEMLQRWENVGYFGSQIDGFAEIDTLAIDHFKRAIFELGCVVLCVRLPLSASRQFAAGHPWSPVPWSPIQGGHAVLAVSFGPDGFNVVTWGKLQPVTWDFLPRYTQGAFACVSPQFLNATTGTTPGGLTLDGMRQALASVRAAA
jgi:hypothetical protein